MIVTSPQLKSLILDLIMFEDAVDESGKPAPRKYYPKIHMRGVAEIKKKFIASLEIAYIPKDADPKATLVTDALWQKPPAPDGMKGVMERMTAEPIDLSSQAIQVIKHYHAEREDLPEVTEETLDQLFELMKATQ